MQSLRSILRGADRHGRVDAATVALGATGTMNFLAAGAGTGALPTTPNGSVKAHACLNCPGIVMTQPDGGPVLLPDGGLKPDTLAIVPDVPLTERTLYAAYITTDLKDTNGKNVLASPAFALVRSSAPLFDGTHSTVSLLTDAQAQQLDPLRAGLKPLFDQLALNGLPAHEACARLGLHHSEHRERAVPAPRRSIRRAGPDCAAAVGAGIPAPGSAPNPGGVVGHWYIGQILDIFALTGTGGTINPDTTGWTAPKIGFVMSVPAAGPPASGYPVTIFGHGLGR